MYDNEGVVRVRRDGSSGSALWIAAMVAVALACGRTGYENVSGQATAEDAGATDGEPCMNASCPADQPVVCPDTGCDVSCSEAGSCTQGITCPPGATCIFRCTAPGSCTSTTVSCVDAECIFYCEADTCSYLDLNCSGESNPGCMFNCCSSGGGGATCSFNTCTRCDFIVDECP